MRTLEKMSTRLPLQSPRFLLGLFRLLLAEGRSQCCSLACRFWRIKPLAMAAAMAARRLARDGQGGGRRGAQPRRGPIPGGSGLARASLLPSGTRGGCRGEAPPPRYPAGAALPPGVTAWAPRRPAPAAAGGGARSEAGSGQSSAPRSPARAGGFVSPRPGCPLSALRCRRPLARRCHRSGSGRLPPPPLAGSRLMIAKCFGNQHLERAVSFSWESCNHSSSVPPRSSLPTHAHAHTHRTHTHRWSFFVLPSRGAARVKGMEEGREKGRRIKKKGRGAGGAVDAFFLGETASSQRIPHQQPLLPL